MSTDSKPTAEELAAQAVQGDSNAWRELYDMHWTLRAWLASRIPRDEVDDVFQEVWLRICRELAARFDGVNFRAWMFRIANNLLVDRGRRRKVRRESARARCPNQHVRWAV